VKKRGRELGLRGVKQKLFGSPFLAEKKRGEEGAVHL